MRHKALLNVIDCIITESLKMMTEDYDFTYTNIIECSILVIIKNN